VSDPDVPPDGRTVIAEDGTSAVPGERRAPRREIGLAPGDMLNGIYRVDRFIARGGMGEVFEGVNIESDERVAIKAMRSHLAADPKVLAMFRKEAQVLTRIAHPAIVQYRVLARDPELDLYYIVTDYIDGEPLSAHLDGASPSPARIVDLARRLASGLEAAHEHGAIHRDMSPDNILLPDGRLERAKIIDFGIAKSLDVTAETVVGDGFAGKLGYVAPEQFGDYDRQIGPWTDVYSTALVLLAFARGKAPDMGATLSEAVQRRRDGPDLSGLPTVLEPLLQRMLVPDPLARIRSMMDVLVELDRIDAPSDEEDGPLVAPPAARTAKREESAAGPAPLTATPLTTFLPFDPPAPADEPGPMTTAPAPVEPRKRWSRRMVGALVAIPLLIAAGFVMTHAKPQAARPAAAPSPKLPIVIAPVAQTAADVPALLSTVPCSWLHARGAGSGAPLQLRGGAQDPATVNDQVQAGARARGQSAPAVNTADVVPVPASRCDAVEAMRGFDTDRDDRGFALISAVDWLALVRNAPGCPSGLGARPDLTIVEHDPAKQFALVAIAPSGDVRQIVSGRKEFARLARRQPSIFQDLGDGRYQVSPCYHAAGAVGLVLVDGPGPIDLGLSSGPPRQPPANFADRFRSMAQSHGWRTRAVWLRIDAAAPAPPAPQPLATPPAQPSVPAEQTPVAPPSHDAALRPAFRGHAGAIATSDFAACRRYTGRRWEELGYSSGATCVERVFKNQCAITYGQFGESPLRRYNRQIEMQRGDRWWPIARTDECVQALLRQY
jgi:serine/threonine-protein kinase